jgi:hypothetical protein
VADESMADYFGVTLEDLARLRAAPRVELDIDAFGRPVIPTPRPSGRRKRDSALPAAAVHR